MKKRELRTLLSWAMQAGIEWQEERMAHEDEIEGLKDTNRTLMRTVADQQRQLQPPADSKRVS